MLPFWWFSCKTKALDHNSYIEAGLVELKEFEDEAVDVQIRL